MIRVPKISKILLLRRCIDDIIFFAKKKNKEISEEIIKNLKEVSEKYGLKSHQGQCQ